MNPKRLILMAPLLGFAAAAAASEYVDVEALAADTGLTERQVRMVLGNPSSFAEYRTSYQYAEQRVLDALAAGDYTYEATGVVQVGDIELPPQQTVTTTTTTEEVEPPETAATVPLADDSANYYDNDDNYYRDHDDDEVDDD